jgi:glutathione synthase/RimK-type ligase-like ATP-grasp enzyme
MILFCGVPSEAPLRLAIEAAEKRKLQFLLLNQRNSHYLALRLTVTGEGFGGALAVGDATYRLSNIHGIYSRMIDSSVLPENRAVRHRTPDPAAVERSRVFHEAFCQWLELADCRVLNRPGAMASNMSKPYQCRVISRCGFEIPTTLVTNDPDEATAFHRQQGRVIFKSISSIRSIVREFNPNDRRALQRLRHLPTQFQAFVPGVNLRVHTAGPRLFATEILTGATDYRYAARDGQDLTMRPIELPDDIAARCLRLSQELNLPLCGIDLKRTPDGAYYCFEVNPSPAYSFYQEQTGQPIAEAIVDYLLAPYNARHGSLDHRKLDGPGRAGAIDLAGSGHTPARRHGNSRAPRPGGGRLCEPAHGHGWNGRAGPCGE